MSQILPHASFWIFFFLIRSFQAFLWCLLCSVPFAELLSVKSLRSHRCLFISLTDYFIYLKADFSPNSRHEFFLRPLFTWLDLELNLKRKKWRWSNHSPFISGPQKNAQSRGGNMTSLVFTEPTTSLIALLLSWSLVRHFPHHLCLPWPPLHELPNSPPTLNCIYQTLQLLLKQLSRLLLTF